MVHSLQDLQRAVECVTDVGVEVHFVRDNLSFGDGKDSPMARLQMYYHDVVAVLDMVQKDELSKPDILPRLKPWGSPTGG